MVKARGLCKKHYERKRLGKHLTIMEKCGKKPRKAIDRFWDNVNKDGSIPEYAPWLGKCWIWNGNVNNGYGRFKVEEKDVYVHRFSYETFMKQAKEFPAIDHLCRVTLCVNPEHLEPTTDKINTMRGIGAAAQNHKKTHCIHGHEFSIENTYITINRYGFSERHCKECSRKYSRERYRKERISEGVIPKEYNNKYNKLFN